MPHARRAAAGALFILFLSACATQPDPHMREVAVSVGERTEAGQVLNFNLLADNPGSEALPLREVRYTLVLNGKAVFSGVRSPEATLRRYGAQRITIPAVVPSDAGHPLPAGDVPYTLTGTMTYIRPGAFAEVLFDAEVSQPSFPFAASGKIPL